MNNRLLAVSDLHGMYPLWEQIKNFLEPNDILYVLGDCGDRGPDGWKIIKEVLKHPQCVYLKGNHEDMLVQAYQSCRKYLAEEEWYGICHNSDYRLLCNNGGEQTFRDMSQDEYMGEWIKRINDLPTHLEIDNNVGDRILLSHAGYTPAYLPNDEELIWNRDHFGDRWFKDYGDNTIIVHGHTPWPHLLPRAARQNFEPGALVYCDGHKVDLDNGAFATGSTVVLDLDSFDQHIFTIPNFKNI